MTATETLALTAVSMTAALGLARVFGDASSVVPALLTALVAHSIAAYAARRRWPSVVTGGLVALGTLCVVAWTLVPSTTTLGLPGVATVREIAQRFREGLEQIRTSDVPVPHDSGIVVIAAVGMPVVALTAHSVATRARGVLTALVPAATLFILTSALGTSEYRTVLTVDFVAVALLFVLARGPARTGGAHGWFAAPRAGSLAGAVLPTGLVVVALAAAGAPLVGPHLPEARSAGLVQLQGAGGDHTRVTVSPLIDIRDRLTQQPPVEVFTVEADRPSYWRLAALDQFDGQVWTSLANYSGAEGHMPTPSPAIPTTPLLQRFRITNLSQFWLPAAYIPESIDLPSARVNADSLTLLTERPTADGLTYSVRSAVPTYTAAELGQATGRVPSDIRPELELPDDVPPAVVQLAARVAGSEVGPFAKARALQDFFRTNFVYTENVPSGHSDRRLLDFLFVNRAGYCEQFASAFAIMARSLGIPSRIAVGFTPGQRLADGRFEVTTRQAHAWPEVYLDPFGWVAFEPTPTRANPAPGDYTGTRGAPGATSESPAGQESGVTPSTGAATPTVPTTATLDRSRLTSPTSEQSNPWLRGLALVGAAIALLLALSGLVLLWNLRRRRARLRHLDARGQVLAAWDEVVVELRLDGLTLPPSLTPRETTAMAVARAPHLATSMATLGELVDHAAYARPDPGSEAVEVAWRAAASVVTELHQETTRTQRLRRALLSAVRGARA